MDISQIYDKIKEYISYSIENKEYELEAIFTESKKITSEKFKEIFQYFSELDDYDIISSNENESLDIRIISNKKYDKYRLTLNTKDEIMKYCKKNTYDSNSIFYGEKRRLNKFPALNLESYPFKFNLKYDTVLDDNEKKEEIDKIIKTSKKYFRFKKRFTFLSKSELFKIDLSLVKSSNNYSKYFYDSGILNQKESYEIEIELNNENIDDKDKLDKIIKELFNIIGNILLIVEDNDFIISTKEKEEVKKAYLQLAFDLEKSKVENMKIINPKKYFIGVQPVTLELTNLLEEDESRISILKNYSVTDKADGERNLLYIHTNNRVYLINNRLKIKYTGLKHTNVKTIIDGEYITKDRNEQDIKVYMAFDVYFHKGNDVSNKPLISKNKSRMDILDSVINNKENKFIPENSKSNKLVINTKDFKHADGDKLLKKHCKTIIDNNTNGNYEYNIDGLILTPINLAVGAKREGDDSSLTGTWNRVFKWKPPEENTIDFLVKFVDEIDMEVSGINRKYMFCKLYVGFDQNLEINPIKILNNEFDDNIYAMKEFAECYLEINSDNNIITLDNHIIENDMIIEVSYNNENDNPLLKWVPNRIRYDKTELYRMTKKISGTANDYTTAQNVWNTIQHPVTYDIITGKEKVEESMDAKNNINGDVYYAREVSREQSLLKPLLGFHNYWVKNQYLYRRFSGPNSLFEIACGKGGDLMKWTKSKYKLVIGADISSDNLYNINDGLYKRYNQLVKKGTINTDKQKMLFMVMDASKKWDNKYINSINDETSQRFAKISFGLVKKSDINKDESVLLDFYNKINKKFNLVSCMFAIHYMFENDEKLNNFIHNINLLMKDGGFFFGTCLDGYLVSEKLKNKNEIRGEINGNPLWIIKKEYDDFDTYNVNKPLENIGKRIKVYMETINQMIDEYLVDYELLKYKLGQYNIRPLNDEDLKKFKLTTSSGSFEDIFNHFSKNKKNKIEEMESVHKEYSFLNRWFIFKKYSS